MYLELDEENGFVCFEAVRQAQKEAEQECGKIEHASDEDAIIITVLWDFENIYDHLRKVTDRKILSAKELIEESL